MLKSALVRPPRPRTWFKRTFSKINTGSLRGSIMVALTTALGTGLFTFHHLIKSTGLLFFFVIMILHALAYYFVSHVLSFVSEKNTDCNTLSQLVRKVLGVRWMWVFESFFVLYLFLTELAYMLTISHCVFINFRTQISSYFYQNRDVAFAEFNSLFIYVIAALLVPINLLNNMNKIRYASIFSVAIILYIVVVASCQVYPFYQEARGESHNFSDFDLLGFFGNYGIALYSYGCLSNFYGVVNMVHNPSLKRLKKIYFRTFMFLMLLFIFFGTVTNYSLPDSKKDATDLFIFREGLKGQGDLLMLLGRMMLVVALWISSVTSIYPLKLRFYNLVGNQGWVANCFIVFVINSLAAFIASVFFNISDYINLFGQLFIIITIFDFPIAMGFRLGYFGGRWARVGIWGFLGVLNSVCVVSTVVSSIQFFGNGHSH